MHPGKHEAIRAGRPALSPRLRVARWWLVFAAATLAVLAGCGGDPAPAEVTPPPQVSTAGGPGTGDLGGPVEPLSPSDAATALLEAATYDTVERGQYSYTIIVHIGGDEFAATTFTIDPNERPLAGLARTSTPLHDFEYRSDLGSSRFDWRMRYVVPAAEFPPDAFAVARPGERPGWLDRAVLALLRPAEAHAQEGGGYEVIVEGVLNEVRSELLSQIIGEDLATFEDAVSNISDALDAGEWYRRQLRELERLRQCAENPTNPLTRRMYEDDPASKDRIMREVRQTELDVKSNTMVRFVGMMTSQGSGLVRWLGFVVGPVTSWADQQLVRLTEERIRQLRDSITPCDDDDDDPSEDGQWTGTITYRWNERRVVNMESENSWSRSTTEQSGEIRWKIEQGAVASVDLDGVAKVLAPYTFEAGHQGTGDRGNRRPFSCPGDQRGGMHTATHTTNRSENGEITAEGQGEVTVRVDENGFFFIEARAGRHPGLIHWEEQTRASGGACYIGPPDKDESGTSNFNPRLALPQLYGQIEGRSRNVLSGTDEQSEDWSAGDTSHTVSHVYEWNLTRE